MINGRYFLALHEKKCHFATVMGRNRTRLELGAAERIQLERLSRILTDARDLERLKAVRLAAEGRLTLQDLAQILGRSRSTIQNCLDKFDSGRIDGLLERDTPPGSMSPI